MNPTLTREEWQTPFGVEDAFRAECERKAQEQLNRPKGQCPIEGCKIIVLDPNPATDLYHCPVHDIEWGKMERIGEHQ